MSDQMWWGWNFAKTRWFPCLEPEYRECVTPEGVIVYSDLDHRDERRDQLIAAVRAVFIEALAVEAEANTPAYHDVTGAEVQFKLADWLRGHLGDTEATE